MTQIGGFKTCVGPGKRDWRTIQIYSDLFDIYIYIYIYRIKLGICSAFVSLGGFIVAIHLYKEATR